MMNINGTPQTQIKLLPRNNRLDVAYEAIDDLHTAISEGDIETLSEYQNRAELLNWLRDVIYTAQETIVEIESTHDEDSTILRVVSNEPKLIVLEKVN